MLTPSREIFAKYTDSATFDKIKEYDTVSEMWESCVAAYGADIAVEDDGKRYSFSALEADAAALRGVIDEGEAPKRIGLLAANSYDFAKAFVAITTLGYTAVVLPPQLPAEAVFGCCMQFGVSALVYMPSLEEKTAPLAGKCRLIKTTDCAAPKSLRHTNGKTPCAIMFTGGTTGKSKGALLSNAAIMQGVVNGCYGYRDVFAQRYLLVLPLSHIFGLVRNLLTSLYTGSTLFICRNNKDMFRDIAMFKPTVLVLVPALAEMALTLSKKFGRNMLGEDMKYIICGAAAVAPYLIAEYAKLGITLFPGYGLTESANLVSGNPEGASKPESVGIPYPNQELKIVDGELYIKGKNMMEGYVGVENGYTEDGFFKTGDLARFDEDGFLYITGRTKEIIVLANGENISPAELEAKFNALSCVQDSQVFEDVNAVGAHILALEVVPRLTELTAVPKEEQAAYVTAELEKVNASLLPHERVNSITIRTSDFERTPSMKIVRYKKC